MFSGTIRENILYGFYIGNAEEELAALDEACKDANALSFIKDEDTFPLGYDTVVGERGVKLSGG